MRKIGLLLLLVLACAQGPTLQELREQLEATRGELEQIREQQEALEQVKNHLAKVEEQLAIISGWQKDPDKLSLVVSRVIKVGGTSWLEIIADRGLGRLSIKPRSGQSAGLFQQFNLKPEGEKLVGSIPRLDWQRHYGQEPLASPSPKPAPRGERQQLLEELQEARKLLEQTRRELATMPALKARIQEGESRLMKLVEIFPGPEDPGAPEDKLRSDLNRVLGKAGRLVSCQVDPKMADLSSLSTAPIPPAPYFGSGGGGFPAWTVTLELNGQPSALARFLVQLEGGQGGRACILTRVVLTPRGARARMFIIPRP